MDSWLPLTDYSSKYKLSISTLRRRIKAEDIKFRFQDGKYLILDEPPTGSPQPRAHRPSLDSAAPDAGPVGPSGSEYDPQFQAKASADEPILIAANKLLNELKRAYTQILQEKEEQILNLKVEASDLKTLVRVLESENARLRQ